VAFGPGLLGTLGKCRLFTVPLTVKLNGVPCLMTGEQHKRQRKMLNPVFSIAHMREMGASSLSASIKDLFLHICHKFRPSMSSLTRLVP